MIILADWGFVGWSYAAVDVRATESRTVVVLGSDAVSQINHEADAVRSEPFAPGANS
jgi:hypothetical protein